MQLINLKRVREDKLVTQEELAERASVSLGTISRIENGRPCTIKVARRLADALDVPPQDLFRQTAEAER